MDTAQPARKSHTRRRPATNSKSSSPDSASLTRHQRLCSICQHPNREDIEDDILRWRSFEEISFHFRIGSRSTVYRHARALNLLDQRKENLCPALETLIESVYRAKPTGNAILKAMTIYARLNGNNSFADPPKRVLIKHIGEKPSINRRAIAKDSPEAVSCPDVGRNRAENDAPKLEVQALNSAEKDAAKESTLAQERAPLGSPTRLHHDAIEVTAGQKAAAAPQVSASVRSVEPALPTEIPADKIQPVQPVRAEEQKAPPQPPLRIPTARDANSTESSTSR